MAFRNGNGTQLGKIGPFYDDSDIHIQNDVGGGHIVLRTKTGDSTTKRFTVNTSGAEVHGDLTVTNGTIAGTLNSSVTATTQAATDSSTKIATTAFAKNVFSDQQTAIDAKLPLAGGTLTGNLKLQDNLPRLLLVDSNNGNTNLPDYLLQLNEGVLKISEKTDGADTPSFDRIYIQRKQNGTDGNGDPVYERSVELKDEVVLKKSNPKLILRTGSPSNYDYRLQINSGNFEIEDSKNDLTNPRLRIFDNGDVKIWKNLTLEDEKTVDGRDISADGTKLDGIEDNATADQTAAEIRTLVESASDSNVFTDADHTKLDGIPSDAINASNAAITNKLPLAGGTLTGNVRLEGGKNTTYNPDATGGGLVINHTGTVAQFRNLTGQTRVSCADGEIIRLNNTDGSKIFATFGGATSTSSNDEHVDLYFNNARKATTVTDGLQVIGKLRAGFETNLPTPSSSTRAVFTGALDSNDNSASGISIFCKGNGNSRINFGNTLTEESSQIKYRNTHNDLQFLIRDTTSDSLNTQLEINSDSVELNYDGTKKAETSATGFDVLDRLLIKSTSPGIDFEDTTTDQNTRYRWNAGGGTLQLQISTNDGNSYSNSIGIGGIGNIFIPDSDKVNFGTGNDLSIVHDGSNSKITNKTGNLDIQGDAIRLLNKAGNEFLLQASEGGAISLYYDGAIAAQTTNVGFNVVGSNFKLRNSANNADLVKIFHSGASDGNTLIAGQVGDIKIQPNEDGGQVRLFETTSGTTTQRLVTTNSGINVSGTVTESSDVALKENIQPLSNVLEKVKQLTGYKYNFKNTTNNSMGVIAQDVEKVFPELVHGEEGEKSLQYSGLIGALIESIKELSDKISVLEAKN